MDSRNVFDTLFKKIRRLPVSDLDIRKAMQRIYSLPELPRPSTMLAIAQPWKPYRSIAVWYLWKSLSKFDSI